MNAAAGWVLGIDFGVVNTAAALRNPDGHVTELRLSGAGALMPSAVFRAGEQVLVGERAIQAAASDPAAFEPYPKRRVAAGPATYVPELIAAVLADVLERTSAVTGDGFPDQLVLTYPDGQPTSVWESRQVRDALQEAADLLVCRSCALIPVSTAVTSFVDNEPQYIAPVVVVNFSATHCDAVVCTRQHDGTYAAVASRRVDGLGAFTVEARVREWLARSVRGPSATAVATLDWPDPDDMLVDASIRDAINALSATGSATIELDVGHDRTGLRLSRDLFDVLTRGYVNAAVDLTRDMVATAHRLTHSSAPTVIILTGSAARNPTIRSRIAELGFVADLGDPATIIARGAAYHGTHPREADRSRAADTAARASPARRLVADVTCAGRPCRKSLTPECEHQVEVRMALPGRAENGPTSHAAGDGALELLVDVSSEDGSVHGTAPLMLPMVDTSGASTAAVVKFVTGPDGSTLRLHITVLHQGRPLQAGVLVASVRAKPSGRDRIRLLPVAVSAPPEPRIGTTKADATVEQTSAALKRLGTDPRSEISLSAIAGIIAQLEQTASEMVRTDGAPCRLTDPAAVPLLIDLARLGSRLADKLTGLGLTDARVVALNARSAPAVPLELAYDGPAPDPTAQLCGCVSGARTGPVAAISHASTHTVCPCGFWGMNRLITRSVVGPPVERLPRRPAPAPLSLHPVVYGAADRVDELSPPWTSPVRELGYALIRHAGAQGCTRVSSWRDWRRAVRRTKPQLLVTLGQAEMRNGKTNLVIGRNSALAQTSVSCRELAATGMPAPLVLLFACAGGVAHTGLGELAGAFVDCGAAAVVAPLTPVNGSDAALAVAALVAAARSNGPAGLTLAATVGQARRQLIGQGLLVGLMLVAHGDTDITITPADRPMWG